MTAPQLEAIKKWAHENGSDLGHTEVEHLHDEKIGFTVPVRAKCWPKGMPISEQIKTEPTATHTWGIL